MASLKSIATLATLIPVLISCATTQVKAPEPEPDVLGRADYNHEQCRLPQTRLVSKLGKPDAHRFKELDNSENGIQEEWLYAKNKSLIRFYFETDKAFCIVTVVDLSKPKAAEQMI